VLSRLAFGFNLSRYSEEAENDISQILGRVEAAKDLPGGGVVISGEKGLAGGLLRTTSRLTFDRRLTEIGTWVNAHKSASHHEPCPHVCMSISPSPPVSLEGKSCSDFRSRHFLSLTLLLDSLRRGGQEV